jgi:hypothetical protein
VAGIFFLARWSVCNSVGISVGIVFFITNRNGDGIRITDATCVIVHVLHACVIIEHVYNKNTIMWSCIYYIFNHWINYYMHVCTRTICIIIVLLVYSKITTVWSCIHYMHDYCTNYFKASFLSFLLPDWRHVGLHLQLIQVVKSNVLYISWFHVKHI